jgi:biofilm PGA synthesis N-glycosyltransferase PgaC
MDTTILKAIFWTGLFIILYAYLGYGLLLFLIVRAKRLFIRNIHTTAAYEPDLAFIVCAYNEEDWIEKKIVNSLATDYPRERIRFVFVTDGSDDRTAEMVRSFPYPEHVQWLHLHKPERRGKIAAFQRAMEYVESPVVVSTDANTLVNREAVRFLVRHFSDPRVGAVAGEKRIQMDSRADAGSAGEGIYWRYESLLKKWDSELWTVVGAAGELFAFRREAYVAVPPDTIVEDFYLTMRIAQNGYRVQYEPGAFAVETASASIAEELKRKVRIAAGGLQAVARLAPLLNFFRYGVLSFQYISHRVLRWTLAPIFLPVLLVVNTILAARGEKGYLIFLVVQLLFYLAAFFGFLMERQKMKVKAFFVPYYFCLMNYSMYAGLVRLLRGRQSVLWERAKRA